MDSRLGCVCSCAPVFSVCVCIHEGIPTEVCMEPLELKTMDSPFPGRMWNPHLSVEEPTWPWGAKESSPSAAEASFARGWGGEDRRVTG